MPGVRIDDIKADCAGMDADQLYEKLLTVLRVSASSRRLVRCGREDPLDTAWLNQLWYEFGYRGRDDLYGKAVAAVRAELAEAQAFNAPKVFPSRPGA